MAATDLSPGPEPSLAPGTAAATVVLKFGGGAVADPPSIRFVAGLLLAARRAGERVVAVVSAPPDARGRLLRLAREVSPRPTPREYDLLLSSGERIAAALCAMAVNEHGGDAVSLTGAQAGIVTDGAHGRASILGVRPRRVALALDAGRIVVVAGGQGVSTTREVTTLGRPGSDLTAVALAASLDARCELVVDAPPVYSADRRIVPGAVELSMVTYDELLALPCPDGVAPEALALARDLDQALLVRSLDPGRGTWVASGCDPLLYGAEIAGVAVESPEPPARGADGAFGRISLVGTGVRMRPGLESAMVDALSAAGITARGVTCGESRITCVVAASELCAAATAVHERFGSLIAKRAAGRSAVQVAV